MKNKRWELWCDRCESALQDNESYDFRVCMYKTEGPHVWVFIDDEVDTSGMICKCEDPDPETWISQEIPQ